MSHEADCAWEQTFKRYEAAVQRIIDLHKPFYNGFHLLCSACFEGRHDGHLFYPCPTIKALDGEQE